MLVVPNLFAQELFMYQNQQKDRNQLEQALQNMNVWPDEVSRLSKLGDVPETEGQELLMAVSNAGFTKCLASCRSNQAYLHMEPGNQRAIDLEGKVARGIGSVVPSCYKRLFIGGTDQDAPTDPDVVHVNVLSEDMWFTADGPRILIDGRSLPLPDKFFSQVEGYHIPYVANHTDRLIAEIFRTAASGAVILYAPSMASNITIVVSLFQGLGFKNVRASRQANRTVYQGRITLPTLTIEATKP